MSDERSPALRTAWMPRLAARLSTRALVVVGVLATTGALVLALLTWQALGGAEETAGAAAEVETERVVSRRGGFAVAVPTDMEVRRRGRTLALTGADPQLVVNVGPASSRRLGAAHRMFLAAADRSYTRLRVIGRERGLTGGRPSLTTSATAVNEAGAPIRFLVVTIAARPRPYTLVAFAARSAAPGEVLPRLHAVVEGFEVLPR